MLLPAELVLNLPPGLRNRPELDPLRYAVLRAAGRLDALPPLEAERARRAYFATLVKNVRALGRATEILDAAEAAGVRMMPYKGALFADALYGDPGARPMVDLDLLVHPADLGRAVELVAELGFRRAFAPGTLRFTPRHGHDVSFVDAAGTQWVELHYRLFHELAGDASIERLFERAVALPALGRERRVPAFSDHLFAVAVHAVGHALGDSPMWVFDLALLLERAGGLDEARAEAGRRGYRAAFEAAVRAAHAALPSRVPAPYPAAGIERVRARLVELVLGRDPLAQPATRIRSLLARAVLTEHPRNAAREVVRKLGLRTREALGRGRV